MGNGGTLIFLMFDRHAFLGHFGNMNGDNGNTIPPIYKPFLDNDEKGAQQLYGDIKKTSELGSQAELDATGVAVDGLALAGDGNIKDLTAQAAAFFSDQVLPFDVTLAAANEYGSLAVMRIYGCEILNEGYGVSIDDIDDTSSPDTLESWDSVNHMNLIIALQ